MNDCNEHGKMRSCPSGSQRHDPRRVLSPRSQGRMRTSAAVELDAGTKTFASGLLPDLIDTLRRSRQGDLVAVISGDPSIGPELEAWCRFTRNSLVDVAVQEGHTRWVFRYGEAPEQEDRPVGSRLWLYTNFDCNLCCDYCCVRSSPKAPR